MEAGNVIYKKCSSGARFTLNTRRPVSADCKVDVGGGGGLHVARRIVVYMNRTN